MSDSEDTENINSYDLGEFNKSFDEYKKNVRMNEKKRDDEKLNKMDYIKYTEPIFTNKFILKLSETWINLIEDIFEKKFSFTELLKNDRGLYIGITFILLFFLINLI